MLPLLEEGIGADIISDMTQTIIDDDICQFTVDTMQKLGLTGTHLHITKARNSYRWCNEAKKAFEPESVF